MTGETFTPDSPFIRDLYYKILPSREEVLPAALSFAKDLAENTSQLAVAYTKGLLLQPGASIEENHILDSRSLKILASGADAAEGAKAFIERRPVNFKATLSKDSSPWYPWVSSHYWSSKRSLTQNFTLSVDYCGCQTSSI